MRYLWSFGLMLITAACTVSPPEQQAKNWTQVFNDTKPSVVMILTQRGVGGPKGAGFFVTPNTVLTAGHAARMMNELDVVVRLHDGTELAGKFEQVSDDPDLALIDVPGADQPTLSLNCADAAHGEQLMGIGHPLRFSYVAKWFHAAGHDDKDGSQLLDGEVLPGDSGGPVVDQRGDVRGVMTGSVVAEVYHLMGVPTPLRSLAGIAEVMQSSAVCTWLAQNG